MGMYDTMHVELLCAHGHTVNDFQTKSLTNTLSTFFIRDHVLYGDVDNGNACDKPLEEMVLTPTGLNLVSTRHYPRCDKYSGSFNVYSSCDECLPVVVYTGRSGWTGPFSAHHPRVEYTITILNGKMASYDPHLQTRDALRAELVDAGLRVMKDDDYAVQEFIKAQKK